MEWVKFKGDARKVVALVGQACGVDVTPEEVYEVHSIPMWWWYMDKNQEILHGDQIPHNKRPWFSKYKNALELCQAAGVEIVWARTRKDWEDAHRRMQDRWSIPEYGERDSKR
jgi:hypothetical protein